MNQTGSIRFPSSADESALKMNGCLLNTDMVGATLTLTPLTGIYFIKGDAGI